MDGVIFFFISLIDYIMIYTFNYNIDVSLTTAHHLKFLK